MFKTIKNAINNTIDATVINLFDLVDNFEVTSLFASGEEGAWYDPSDLSTLFQDSAGTTPVTANGDPVGLMLDKSGNGRHAFQTVASKRPTYSVVSGVYSLVFDGVDDFLETSTPSVLDNGSRGIFASVKMEQTSQLYEHIVHSGQNSTGKAYGLCSRLNNIDNLGNHYWGSVFNTDIICDDVGSDVFYVNKDGSSSSYGRYGTGDTAAETHTATTGAGNYRIFVRLADTELGKGNLFGLVLIDRNLSSSELQQTNSFLANKHG